MKLKPLGDRLIVRAIEEEETTASGIVLPDTAKEKPQKGKVLAVGDGKLDDDGKRIPLDVSEGDEVLYSKYGGTEIKIDGEDVAGAEDEVLLAAVLDLGAAVLAVDHLVADLDVERHAVAVVVDPTRADREDLALLGLLLGGVRDDQTRRGGLLRVEGLHEDPVLERLDVDRHFVDLLKFFVDQAADRLATRQSGTRDDRPPRSPSLATHH
jgi:chaperonin GroES